MTRLYRLQFIGPLALFAATLAAELAAHALDRSPGSELLWQLNLGVFSTFQRSYVLLSEYVALQGFQLYGVALPIFLLACVGLARSSRLALALATHLSAAHAAFLIVSWQVPGAQATQAALGGIAMPVGSGAYVLSAILGACLVSILLSHLMYFRVVREEL